MLPLPLNSKVCIISARRFGDAIINAALVKIAAKSRPDIKWVVWTKQEFTPLFKEMGFSEILTSEFPIAGGTLKFVKNGGASLTKSIFKLREKKISASIDFIGDAREALLGSLIAGKNHYSPKWSASHWMNKLIWNFKIPGVTYLPIPKYTDQMYEVISTLLENLTGVSGTEYRPYQRKAIEHPLVAFHLFSSQEFKNWPKSEWQKLSGMLNATNITPIVLCSKEEESKVLSIFPANISSTKIVITESLEDLISQIKSIDFLIGVDSFLVHLASALDKKTVVINAGNLPRWWQPPLSEATGQSGGCTSYPCSNKPTCLKMPNESQCIKSITADQVMQLINTLLAPR